jgi:hypothetical protein
VKRITNFLLILQLVAGAVAAADAGMQSGARKVSDLIDPAKLATLDSRGANPRVQKYVALLAEARAAGASADSVAREAVRLAGMKGQAAKLTAEAMGRNLLIADRLGCLNSEGLREMRRGNAPTVQRGPYKGDQLSVDHIIPRSVAPELDKVIANLELMPQRMNAGKRAKVGDRQQDLARRLNKAGLLSNTGLKAVKAAR